MRNITILLLLVLFAACAGPEARIPDNSTAVKETAKIYPEYRDIIIPPNIAPLNIMVKNQGEQFVGSIEGNGKQVIAAAGEDGKLMFDTLAWRDLLKANTGKELTVTLYAQRKEGWVKFPSYKISVATDPIDRYLSYRLIEPSYELYRQLGLYQRDLEGFSQNTIYENNRDYDADENHCVNCHNYQNYSTKRMLFHVRAKHGGTMFVEDGKPEKVDFKNDSLLSSAVYPTWHPQKNWVVFSSNQTGQAFHISNHEKIEVVDYGSDLIFYDADKHEVSNILKTDTELETFPCWSPDGKKVFFTSAHVPQFAGATMEKRRDLIIDIYKDVRYNVMSITFDPATHRFGSPVVEYDCASLGKSASVTRVSPDGRYLLFTLADFGQFHIWHNTADLYVKDLQTGEVYPLTDTNAPGRPDSYHTWSSNGRWIVFVSRRDDGSYSRPYIAYFDKNGKGHKAFILPQEDPEQNILLPKSYNVPELTRDAVRTTPEQLKQCIYNDDKTTKVTYKALK